MSRISSVEIFQAKIYLNPFILFAPMLAVRPFWKTLLQAVNVDLLLLVVCLELCLCDQCMNHCEAQLFRSCDVCDISLVLLFQAFNPVHFFWLPALFSGVWSSFSLCCCLRSQTVQYLEYFYLCDKFLSELFRNHCLWFLNVIKAKWYVLTGICTNLTGHVHPERSSGTKGLFTLLFFALQNLSEWFQNEWLKTNTNMCSECNFPRKLVYWHAFDIFSFHYQQFFVF